MIQANFFSNLKPWQSKGLSRQFTAITTSPRPQVGALSSLGIPSAKIRQAIKGLNRHIK
jgi:hypothetical protein